MHSFVRIVTYLMEVRFSQQQFGCKEFCIAFGSAKLLLSHSNVLENYGEDTYCLQNIPLDSLLF